MHKVTTTICLRLSISADLEPRLPDPHHTQLRRHASSVLLNGCGRNKEQQLAHCKLDALNRGITPNDVKDHLVICMEARGHKFDSGPQPRGGN